MVHLLPFPHDLGQEFGNFFAWHPVQCSWFNGKSSSLGCFGMILAAAGVSMGIRCQLAHVQWLYRLNSPQPHLRQVLGNQRNIPKPLNLRPPSDLCSLDLFKSQFGQIKSIKIPNSTDPQPSQAPPARLSPAIQVQP